MKNLLAILLAVLAIIILLEHNLGRFGVSYDQARQYVAAKQISEGNGVVKPVINKKDLSRPEYRTHTEFPPGLSLLASSLFLFIDNVHIVHLILSLLTQFLLLFLIHRLYCSMVKRRINLTISFSIFFLYMVLNGQLLLRGGTSDLICVIIYLGVALLLLNNFHQRKNNWVLAISCFMMVLTVYFRYAYLPSLLVLPCYFLFLKISNSTDSWAPFLKSVVFTLLLSTPFLLHIYFINSATGYVSDTAGDTSSWYWANLIQANPFPLHSFYELYPILKAIGYPSDYGYDRGYIYPNWIHFIFYAASLFILIPAFLYYYRDYKVNGHTKRVRYALYSSIFGIGLVAFIFLGSVLKPSVSDYYNWSWAKVFRYYILITLFLQFSYFLIATGAKGVFKWLALLVLGSSLCFSMSHKVYNYSANYRFFDFEHNTKVLRSNDALLNSYRLHQALIKNSENYFILIANPHEVSGSFSMMEQMVEISNGNLLLIDNPDIKNLNTSEPLEVFYISQNKDDQMPLEIVSIIGDQFYLKKALLQPL
jgi:hypothetical protein